MSRVSSSAKRKGIVCLHPDGYVEVKDRSSFPTVEEVFASHPTVREVAVVAKPDPSLRRECLRRSPSRGYRGAVYPMRRCNGVGARWPGAKARMPASSCRSVRGNSAMSARTPHLPMNDRAASAAIRLASKLRSRARTLQAMRASLLASATASTL